MKCLDLLSLKYRNSLVIGGAGLLGSQITEVFAEFGSNIIIASRNVDKGLSFVNHIKNKYKDLFNTSVYIVYFRLVDTSCRQSNYLFNGKIL